MISLTGDILRVIDSSLHLCQHVAQYFGIAPDVAKSVTFEADVSAKS